MEKTLRNIAICFTAGAVGGWATTLVATLIPATGIVEATGSHAHIEMHPMWILSPVDTYRLMVWGGLFGLFFLLTAVKKLDWKIWIGLVVILAGPYALFTLLGVKSEDGTALMASPMALIVVLLFLALLVVTPIWRDRPWWLFGLVVGVIAGSSSLFIMFPIKMGAAMFAGMGAGPTTVPWVMAFNLVYGLVTAYFVMRAKLVH
jgi:hypothetical protein